MARLQEEFELENPVLANMQFNDIRQFDNEPVAHYLRRVEQAYDLANPGIDPRNNFV